MNVCKERAKEIFLYLFFLSFSRFFLFLFLFVLFLDYSFLMSPFHECLAKEIHILPRCYTEAVEHNYTGIVRVSWKDRSHPLLRLLGFGLLLLPTNFFSSLFFFPRKNLVRKCPSVVVKSNPDLISVPPIHSRPLFFSR